jgi:ABC-2 type transport system permease protein
VSDGTSQALRAPGRRPGAGQPPRPAPPGPGSGGWADGRYALHAEWTKLRTLPGIGWLLLAAAALTIAVGGAAAGAFSCLPAHGGCSPAATGADPAKISLTGAYAGQAVIAVLGVLVIGGEYGTGMIRVTLAATPRRLTVLAAKAALVAGCALAAGVVAAGGSLLAGRLILPGRGLTAANGYLPLSLFNGPDLRAAAGTVLYFGLIALLALGVTAVVRDQAVGVGVVLGLLYLFPVLTAVIPDHTLARHLEQASPMTAGLYIQVTQDIGRLPLSPWQGLGVTAAWAAGALILGTAALRLRDA